MRLISQATLGEYQDDCEGLHPLTIDRYYGVYGPERTVRIGQTGAGHSPDEDLDDDSGDGEDSPDEHHGILRMVGADVQDQVHHEAVVVPDWKSPFTCIDDETEFWSVLDNAILEDIVPTGYGPLPDEHEADDDRAMEYITVGWHRNKVFSVSLADPIWAKHAQTWCQALAVLTLFELDGYL